MPNLTQFSIDNTVYDVKDSEGRTLIDDVKSYASNIETSVKDLTYFYGDPGIATIKLCGTVVDYRYSNTTRSENGKSMRYTLPKNVKSVNITMHALANLNAYTFLDANDNVISYQRETTEFDATYQYVTAGYATYLICSSNVHHVGSISVQANISGFGDYVNGIKKDLDSDYTLLVGSGSNTYYNKFTSGSGLYSIEYNISGYDYADITSYNVADINKYTMLDSNNNIIGFFQSNEQTEIGNTTTIKVAIPTNASKLIIGTSTANRPNVLVYGIKMSDKWEWENCSGVFVNYRYSGPNYAERANGSKLFSANPFDIYRVVNGIPGQNVNIFTALDSNNQIVGYVSLHLDEITNETYYICPKGTASLLVSGGAPGLGINTVASLNIQKRKTTKRLSVIGDSITTFENFLPGSEYNPFYMVGGHDVSSAAETWWGRIAVEKGWIISTVNAWGGSQVADTDDQYHNSAMCLTRCQNLAENGTPDIIIVCAGTNDFGHAVPLGTWAGHDSIPVTGATFREAYAMMLNKIHAAYPLAKVYCCTLINRERDKIIGNLEVVGGQYLHQFNEAIRQIAMMLNCTVIECESCGINQYNMQEYMGDYHYNDGTGIATHPNRKGMKLMSERILEHLTRE